MATSLTPRVAYELGLKRSDFIPCKTRMAGAGEHDLGTIGVFVLCVEAKTAEGETVRSKQLAYLCKNVTDLYLSNTVLKDLGIVTVTRRRVIARHAGGQFPADRQDCRTA